MPSPFPGMDPYLEHPVLWEGMHARMVVAIANRLQPLLDPRYVATVEERVYIEGPQRRIPDVWIQKTRDAGSAVAVAEPRSTGAVIVEVESLEVHESRIEIVDAYNDMKLVTLIELLSPTNKLPGPGFESYQQKQQEILERDCHLVEIDLLRRGQHVLAVPEWKLAELRDYTYLACVSRWPHRNRYELYPMPLRERLSEISVPLAEPDPDVALPLQDVLTQVYDEGRYSRRLRYDEPCDPPLSDDEQQWANELLASVNNRLSSPHVLIIWDRHRQHELPSSQVGILTSTALRQWFEDHNVQWRQFYSEVDLSHVEPKWKDAMGRPRASLPWIVARNGTRAYEGPLPASVEKTIELLTSVMATVSENL